MEDLIKKYPAIAKPDRHSRASNKTNQDYIYAEIIFHLANEIKVMDLSCTPLIKLPNIEV